MEIWYVNIEKRKDRRELIERQLSMYFKEIRYNRFEGVVPNNEILLKLYKEGRLSLDNYKIIMTGTSSFMTRGSVGCYLSHLEILKKCRDESKIYIVFEDDVIMNKDIEEKIKKVLELMNDNFNIIYFVQPLIEYKKLESYNSLLYKIKKGYSGTYAYIIHPKHAEFLVEKLYYIDSHIDNKLLNLQNTRDVLLFKEVLIKTEVDRNRDSDVMISRRRRLDIKTYIPRIIYYIDKNVLINWYKIHMNYNFINCQDYNEMIDKLKKTGGFIITGEIYCVLNLESLIKICDHVKIDNDDYPWRFIGCSKLTFDKEKKDDLTLIIPSEIFN